MTPLLQTRAVIYLLWIIHSSLTLINIFILVYRKCIHYILCLLRGEVWLVPCGMCRPQQSVLPVQTDQGSTITLSTICSLCHVSRTPEPWDPNAGRHQTATATARLQVAATVTIVQCLDDGW